MPLNFFKVLFWFNLSIRYKLLSLRVGMVCFGKWHNWVRFWLYFNRYDIYWISDFKRTFGEWEINTGDNTNTGKMREGVLGRYLNLKDLKGVNTKHKGSKVILSLEPPNGAWGSVPRCNAVTSLMLRSSTLATASTSVQQLHQYGKLPQILILVPL